MEDADNGGSGGIVVDGLGDVSARTRAAAKASAEKLNSASGVIWVSVSAVDSGSSLALEEIDRRSRCHLWLGELRRTYIPRKVYSSSHHHDFFGFQEGLGVLSSG